MQAGQGCRLLRTGEHLGELELRGEHDRHDQVAPRVIVHLAHRDDRAGQHDRLAQALQHEGERARRVRHRVGAVQDDEAVVVEVALLHDAGQACPLARS